VRNDDWRISWNPTEVKYNYPKKEEKKKFLEKYPIDIWIERVEPAAIHILNSSGYDCKLDTNFQIEDEKLINKICQVESIILKKDQETNSIDTDDVELYAICLGIGAAVAKLCPADYNIIEKLARKLFYHYTIYETWIEYFSPEKFKAIENKIIDIPEHEHPLELVETWSYYREKKSWDSYDELIKDNKQFLNDEWRYVLETSHVGNEMLLSRTMMLKNDLLFNKNKKQWIKWLLHLPNIHIQMAATAQIKNLTDWSEVLQELFELSNVEHSNNTREVKILASLFLYQYFQTAESIDYQLTHWSNGRWTYLEEELKLLQSIKKENKYWQSIEWPSKLKDLIRELSSINEELLIDIITLALCNIKIDVLPKKRIYLDVRKVFISKMAENSKSIARFLSTKQTTASLLNAMILYFELENTDTYSELWDNYLDVIQQKEFYWSPDFNQNLDYFNFAWLSAGILAQQKLPLNSFEKAVAKIDQPLEGWEYSKKNSYEFNKTIVHLYVVGAMAAEWLIFEERQEEAKKLYDYVFNKNTDYLRASSPYYIDYVDQLIIELWARLPLIHPDSYEEFTLQTIPLYDEFKHILLALTVLNANSKITVSLKKLMQVKYDQFYPIVKIKHNRNQALLKWYEQFDWWTS